MAVALEQFIRHLTDSGLMSAEEVRTFRSGLSPDKQPPGDAQPFAKELVRQKKLTAYQATAIYQGKPHGLIFGNYVVLEMLGQGGMGKVFKAEHRRMKRPVALKVMSSNAMKSPDAVKRFHREVEAAAKLTHPNIVAAFDADEAKGVHFLVMEFVEGSDLANLVKKNGPLPVDKAVNCILQAARGLAQAHADGVVHRDIKPANLLLDKTGTVKILDMGLARLTDAAGGGAAEGLTQTGAVMGTVDFMSPEQALHTKLADARADIYSLGCSLWFLLTAKSVYAGDSLMMKLLAHREQPIPSLCALRQDVPQSLDSVFARMVAKRPEERYQSMNDVLRDLEAVVAGTHVSAGAAVGASSWGGGASFSTGGTGEGEDSALQAFLRGISPGASDPAVRTRVANGPSDTLVSRAADQTQTSMLKSVIAKASRLPPKQRWLIGGGVGAALLLAIILALMPDGKKEEVAEDDGKKESGKKPKVASGDTGKTKTEKSASGAPWTTPFANENLDGWKGLPGMWTAVKGTLTGSTRGKSFPHNTFLCSDRNYRDFELEFAVRLVEGRNNSGVQIRSKLDDPSKFVVSGPQADMGGKFWGSLYGEKTVGMMKQSPDSVVAGVKTDDFNDYFIRVVGKHVLIRLNGQIAVDDDFPAMDDEGIIAFQIHSGDPMEVVFRDVRLRELSSGGSSASQTLPPGWISLFDGRDLSGWVGVNDGGPPKWKLEQGYVETVAGTGSIRTAKDYGPDYELHAEFWLPLLADKRGQARANSGIYLNGKHEIQILDNYQNPEDPSRGCGALYGTIPAQPGGIVPPERWQTFDITYRSPRWDQAGNATTPGRLTVIHNAAKVIDDVTFSVKSTINAASNDTGLTGPILLQEHGVSGLRFRNLRIRPLNAGQSGATATTSSRSPSSPRLVPVAGLNSEHDESACWLTPDGMTIYFLREGTAPQPGIYRAKRQSVQAPFAPQSKDDLEFVIPGRHAVLTGDELQMVLLVPQGNQVTLHGAQRAASTGPFSTPSPIAALSGDVAQKSPWLSSDGLTLTYQRTDKVGDYPGKPASQNGNSTEFVQSRRKSRTEVWSSPRRLPLLEDPLFTDALSWPMISDDGLWLFFCNGGGRKPEILMAERSRTDQSFGKARKIMVEGQPLLGRAPRYVASTRELYLVGDRTPEAPKSTWDLFVVQDFSPQTANAADANWQGIFNGRDLTGWKPMGYDGWSVKGGVIVGETTPNNIGWLMSEKDYSDYDLELEYKIGKGSNSGIFPRAWPAENVSGSHYGEIQILDDADPQFIGKIGPKQMTGALFGQLAPDPPPKAPAETWNRVSLSVRGKHLRVTINDVKVIDADTDKLDRPKGHVGLQLYPSRIEFRNIRLSEP